MDDRGLANAWSTLLKVVHGSRETLEVLLPLAAGLTRDQLAALIARASAPGTTSTEEPLEQIWHLLGVVPRPRYDEVLRRYEVVRARLEEAEATIQELRKLLDHKGREAEARNVLDSWGAALQETLKVQAQFVRSLAGAGAQPEPEPKPQTEPPPRRAPRASGTNSATTGRKPGPGGAAHRPRTRAKSG